MKNKFLTFIHPLLAYFDNGNFFRKSFSRLYFIVAIVCLLTPMYLTYYAINLHIAYLKRESARIERKFACDEFQKVKVPYESAMQLKQQYQQILYNSWNRYSYSQSALSNIQMEYNNAANDVARLQAGYDSAVTRYNTASQQHDLMRASYSSKAMMNAYHGHKEQVQLFQGSNACYDFAYESVAPAKAITALVLFIITVLFTGWLSFQLWWDRKIKVKMTSKEGDEFTALPVVAHFIQTVGEFAGIFIAIMGFITAISINFLDVCFGEFGIHFLNLGYISIVIPIIYGFLIIFLFRIIAEGIKALVVIANNTKKQ